MGLNDPPELWRFAVGRSEPVETLTRKEKEKAKAIADRLRQFDPHFAVTTPETYNQFRATLGTPKLRATVQSLANQIEDDAVLARHLATLLKIHKRRPLTKADYNDSRADNDRRTRFLIEHWIQEPLRENWAIASLCFFSDLAMAKLIHLILMKRPLPPTLLTKEPERIRKSYESLGLIPAKPRAIKDIDFEAGKFSFVPFKKRIYRRA